MIDAVKLPTEYPRDTVFGLRGITHGGAKSLTMMSSSGASALSQKVAVLAEDLPLNLRTHVGYLPIVYERRQGDIDAVVRALSVQILEKSCWDEQKNRLGDTIYR